MKLLRDQLSDAVGKNEEDNVKITEFNVRAHHSFSPFTVDPIKALHFAILV